MIGGGLTLPEKQSDELFRFLVVVPTPGMIAAAVFGRLAGCGMRLLSASWVPGHVALVSMSDWLGRGVKWTAVALPPNPPDRQRFCNFVATWGRGWNLVELDPASPQAINRGTEKATNLLGGGPAQVPLWTANPSRLPPTGLDPDELRAALGANAPVEIIQQTTAAALMAAGNT